MAKRKTLDQLTLMDDYMFFQVMRDQDRMKRLLEFILHIKIAKIEEVVYQKTDKEGHDSKEIRLDLYVTDEDGVIYNVEVQSYKEGHLPKRMRFYQSAIDMDLLRPGSKYKELRKSFVIFFCNYDEFERGRYVYTFENRCVEEPDLPLGDDAIKIVFNTKGTYGDIAPEIKEMLIYLDSETVTGEFSQELDDAVKQVKNSEERRAEYKMLQLREMELEAKAEARGEARGEIKGAIKYAYRKGASPSEIITDIMEEFELTRQEAEEQVEEVLGLVYA